MAHEVWKSFDDNALTHSAAHYIMAVHTLVQEQGYARVTDIARHLNITRGSCSISLKALKKRGLVIEDENRMLSLSDEGKRLAELVEKNDALLEAFFHEVLGVHPDQAEIDACKIEHLLSIETSMKLTSFLRCFNSGSKTALAFQKELRTHSAQCTHDAQSCPVCETICFLDDTAR